jgi:hypothetical protein
VQSDLRKSDLRVLSRDGWNFGFSREAKRLDMALAVVLLAER